MKKGAITVYLSLTLLVLLSFILAVIEGARVNAMQVKVECAADLAYDSALAEYHRELLEQYGLFFIDTAYGMSSGSVDLTADHIETYIKKNIDPLQERENDAVAKLAKKVTKDFYKLDVAKVSMEQASFATDHKGEVFREQAIDYMKNVYGIQVLEKLAGEIIGKNSAANSTGYTEGTDQDDAPEDTLENELDQASQNLVETFEEEKARLIKEAKEAGKEPEEIQEIEEVNIEDYNLANKIDRVKNSMIIQIAMKGNTSSISCKQFGGNFVSKRSNRNKGNMEMDKDPLWEEAVDKVIFGEYILEKGGYYGSGQTHKGLDYGAEYVIAGKNSDKENLTSVLHRIFVIRGITNIACFSQDSFRNNLVKVIAYAIASLLRMPKIGDALAVVLKLAWIYFETVVELQDIMAGGSVVIFKSPSDWRTSLSDGLGLSDNGGSASNGMDYQDFIRFFLIFKSNEKQAFRMMDLVEMEIRQTPGNEYFRMDCCMDAFLAISYFTSEYGYDFKCTRKRYYNTGVN